MTSRNKRLIIIGLLLIGFHIAVLTHTPNPQHRIDTTIKAKTKSHNFQVQLIKKHPQEKPKKHQKKITPTQKKALKVPKHPLTSVAQPTTIPPAPSENAKINQTASQKNTLRILNAYNEILIKRIKRYQIYPEKSLRRKQEGRVIVGFTLRKNGTLIHSILLKPSPHSRLNKAALAAVKSAAPFPPFPKPMSESTLTYQIPIDFFIR